MNKEEKAAYNKQWRADNAEKRVAYRIKYNIDNAEMLKDKRIENAEKIKEQVAKWQMENVERRRMVSEQRENDNPEKCKKQHTLGQWKSRGIIGDLSFIYDVAYITATNCWVCKTAFKDTRDRCCDHNHDSGEFRQILCRACNFKDHWQKIIIPKTT